jgi:hypothetical protein
LSGQWFSPGTPVSSTNKTDHHDIAEILLKVAFNTITIKPTPKELTTGLSKVTWWSVLLVEETGVPGENH